jgi:hypothetical protein
LSLGGTSVVGSEAALKIQIREKALLIIKMAATTYANGSKHPIFKQTYDVIFFFFQFCNLSRKEFTDF